MEESPSSADALHPSPGVRMIDDRVLPTGFATLELFRQRGYDGLLLFRGEPIALLEVRVTQEEIRYRAILIDALSSSKKAARIKEAKGALRILFEVTQ